MLFPHEQVREIQDKLLKEIDTAIQKKQNLVAHAPTGLGKTASAIAPALTKAFEKDLTVIFLTSKHTQHKIAIDTLKLIQEKFNKKFSATSILGKKWYCLQPGTQKLFSKDFAEYCRAMVDDDKCEFYTNFKEKGKFSVEAKKVLESLKNKVKDSHEIIEECQKCSLCPYEVSMAMAKNSKLIVTDYYYIFNSRIRNSFLKRLEKDLGECIIIVDEAHNLPSRVKDLASEYLSTVMLERAIKEARNFAPPEIEQELREIAEILVNFGKSCKEKSLKDFSGGKTSKARFDEKYVSRNEFIELVEKIKNYEDLIEELGIIGDNVREDQKYSYIGSVARFLESWKQQQQGFTRIVSVKEKNIILSHRCLDPSVVTRDPINQSYSTILMSGTLTPTTMYSELLGVESVVEKTFKSPFPEKNRLNIIIPKTSTKYQYRNQQQYQLIAGEIDKVVQNIPGNVLVFFPSYYLKDQVRQYLKNDKTLFDEVSGLTKEERGEILEKFKGYKNSGAVLLAVVSGSFGEGIDLPGDELKGVVVVGLPLQKPDLESESLIKYYDEKFGKGWDYGYLFPAFTKTIQSAGRCIRSNKDRGVIVFLDERYAWPNYKRCFPEDWNMKITLMHEKWINEFFRE